MSKLAAVRPAYWIAGVLLAISVVVPLLVSTYAKDEPRLWGFPFFYWYQLLWVFFSAITVSISYKLVTTGGAQATGRQPVSTRGPAAKEGDR